MKFFFTFLLIFCASSLFAQDSTDTYYKIEGDSIFSKSINLKEVTIYKPVKLESQEDLVMYYTLKRKALKVYPYAKMASDRLVKLNSRLEKIKSKNFNKVTLSGCIVEKLNNSLIIDQEIRKKR